MKRVYLTLFSLTSFFSSFATDDLNKKNESKPTVEVVTPSLPEDDKKPNPLKFSGFVDSYYFYNTNNALTNVGVSGLERVFDRNANSFQVGMAQLKTTYTTDKTEAVIDLTFGNHGDLGNYNNFQSPLGHGITSTALAIKQAYLTWKASDKLAITAGQFGTNIGYEVIDAPINYNYSLANLFSNGPFYHTGLKAAYTFNDKVAFMAGVVDGIDSKDDNNKKKGLISQLTLKPKSNLTLYLNYFGSDEGITTRSYYSLFDIVVNYQATEKFYLGLNAARGTQDSKNWGGVAFYTNYAINSKLSLGGRYEYFDNKSGVRGLLDKQGNGTAVNSLTITANYKLTDNILFKPEYRMDSYLKGSNQFVDGSGNAKDSQSTIGAAAIFYF